MLSAKIQGRWADMFPNSKLKYVFNSPAFSDAPVVGDFSYSLSFPNSQANKLNFGFIDRPDAFSPGSEFDMDLFDENIQILSGKFVVTSATPEKITGNLINSAFSFSNLIEGKTTHDLDLGGLHEFPGEPNFDDYINDANNGTYPEFNFAAFIVRNAMLYDGTPRQAEWHLYNYINFGSSTLGRVLFPYLAYVLKQLFATYDYTLSNTIEQQKIYHELLLLCLCGNHQYNRAVDVDPDEQYNLVDFIVKYDLKKLITGVNSLLGTKFFFNQNRQTAELIFLKDLLSASEYTDWTEKLRGIHEKTIEDIKDGFELKHDFDSTDETISNKMIDKELFDKATILEPVLTPADLPPYEYLVINPGDIHFVVCEDSYYMLVNTADEGYEPVYEWQMLTYNFFGKTIGEGKQTLSNILTPYAMSWHLKSSSPDVYWLTPVCDQKLVAEDLDEITSKLVTWVNYDALVNDFQPRIMFYRGMFPYIVPDYDVYKYPFGTSGRHDRDGNEIGNLTLHWDGPDGLYENFWKEWLELIQNNKVFQFEIQLTITDLLNIDMKKKIRIENNYYLIRQITIDFPIEKPATVEMIQI